MDVVAPQLADFARYRVEPGEPFALAEHDPADTAGLAGEEEVAPEYAGLGQQITDLQERLFAEERRALLIVLQGIDAAGKDGTVKHVLRGTNPSGVRVHSFKEPTNDELAHDFLWRYHQATPAKGMIGVFNRSHYEDVLVVRVKDLAPEALWRSRFDSINDFERMLVREGTTILKFFLHISAGEQLEKFRERLERPDKYWKWSENDMKERERWDDYQRAYEEAVAATSTPWAPWYVIPADLRWVRNYVVARVLAGTLSAMNPRFPEPPADVRRFAERELARSRSPAR
jgi:PPK2 family polyphosphate:nucleotide phosphotransferase